MVQFTYFGPDTTGTELFVRSTSSAVPSFDTVQGGWTLQLFQIPSGSQTTPLVFATQIGQSTLVPVVQFGAANDFRRYVPQCPDTYYAWRFYGVVSITISGDYTFCTTSDDGSLFYIDLDPNDKALRYTLLIDNDGLHGAQQSCRTTTLTAGTYQTKARPLTVHSFDRISRLAHRLRKYVQASLTALTTAIEQLCNVLTLWGG